MYVTRQGIPELTIEGSEIGTVASERSTAAIIRTVLGFVSYFDFFSVHGLFGRDRKAYSYKRRDPFVLILAGWFLVFLMVRLHLIGIRFQIH